ncbi:hypothetical protein [Novosphingobium sp. Rr 2-17]|uniref:hypothetical protein n=1 Tax=Novosphingobium sp. Rr 2-17 TaxID=555793 RepID=UPI00063F4E25|nr:hypothetical protein [Novosphingobium sp. Rr 2-17]
MTIAGGHVGEADAGASAASATDAWKAVRAASDIQYTPLPDIKPQVTQTPEWLQALGRFLGKVLEAVFEPIGRFIGMSGSAVFYAFIGLGAVLLAFLIWRLAEPMIDRWRSRQPAAPDPGWTPDRAEAMALLEDADRLAAQGRYGEAAHLLLRRSVRQIADARPDWLQPASTAREIAVLRVLPEAGRQAFGVIAARVERSLFALRDLDVQDWTVARQAYADFALVELRA